METLRSRLIWTDWLFAAVVVLLCGLCAIIGLATPIGSFAHDTFFFLDNAYRVIQGQVPNRDFSSAWGPVMFLIDAAGLELSGLRPAGLGYANAMFGAIVSIWIFLLVRGRWSSAVACILGIHSLLLAVAPFPLGDHPLDFSYAMTYNRYGYALFGIILVECASDLVSPRASGRRIEPGAVSTGIALGLLTFLKISFATVAIPYVAACMFLRGTISGRRILALTGGFMVLTVPILCYLRFDMLDMFRDLAMAASARRLSLEPSDVLRFIVVVENVPILLLAGVLCARKSGTHATRAQLALFTLLTIVAGLLLLISNQQVSEFPLDGYAAVALIAMCAPTESGDGARWPGLPLALLLCLCLLPLGQRNALSLAGAARERLWPDRPHVVALAAARRGGDLLFAPILGARKTETDGAEYVEDLNDGLRVLLANTRERDGVLTIDMFNPFNYLLDRPSPRGGFAAAAYNYIFSDSAHPTPDQFLGDTPYVMVRKYKAPAPDRPAEDRDVLGLLRLYGPALRQEFTAVAESEHWVLWRREGFADQTGRRKSFAASGSPRPDDGARASAASR